MCIEKTPWEQVIEFHGHTCPEIALGFRVAQIARRELEISPSANSELIVTAYTHSCAVDAFQVLNHTTYGRGNLFVHEKKQHVYDFHYSGIAEGLQISIRSEVLEHLSVATEQLSPREKQNALIETLKFILGIEELLFCTIQKL
ncbi:formylmethanofuran dehydrogenase subunit E family protein [Desulfosporosinus sp. BICA1-9]|uniref:formylmethanofuran dehydrogenase subunit E family protein n=1 Tax=Desulfosporosinus sp. BICA1-9 TaxID=1531958 RepID=UPI00054BFE40|nr:formylmethanofuran dehydrogenase subunit E family protein [Desulfosporosinus sp. BICA1-9]KJS49088.1 MAG: formylmethanofuran dehydrogenase [Peptococcaceae bacterium BRH_c23]KJS89802.1 MAG: formylmethanofuran dehydrogenase [Desulfosporosinus sp. BICA1-9]HBW36674.1 formylmethanofuran dehydrogenase [Desulfosporosinus sp.]